MHVPLSGKVYDVTEFLDGVTFDLDDLWPRFNSVVEHPGGSKIILKYAGKDATYVIVDCWLTQGSKMHLFRQEYDPIHPPDAVTTHLPKEKQCVAYCYPRLP
jgi:L-lactate dehydrogenase (cytochrome)